MSVNQQLMTAKQFSEMPDPPDKLLELVDGEVIELEPMGMLAGLVKGNLLTAIDDFARSHELGLVLAGVGCVLRRNPDTVRAPDVSFSSREHVSEGEPADRFLEGAPDLAADVVSFLDLANDVDGRVHDCMDAGTAQVWVLWPNRQAVSIYRPHADTRELGPDATLDGGDILPGFSVTVGDLFEIR